MFVSHSPYHICQTNDKSRARLLEQLLPGAALIATIIPNSSSPLRMWASLPRLAQDEILPRPIGNA
jgi:hypothetical protein